MRRRIGLWARTAYHSLEDIGLQPQRLFALWGLPAYCRDLFVFLRLRSVRPDTTGSALTLAPLLSDRNARAGAGRSLYFLQDLLVSSRVLSQPAVRHLDIGSRIDGFVAQIAASRPIEVLDIRPLEQPPTSNQRFLQGDSAILRKSFNSNTTWWAPCMNSSMLGLDATETRLLWTALNGLWPMPPRLWHLEAI